MSKAAHCKLGREREIEVSRQFHGQGIPLLVGAGILRRRGCGQIDLARIHPQRRHIDVMEVKSSPRLSRNQQLRLERSIQFLQMVFNSSISLSFAFSQKDFFCQKSGL